jgi:hypothetical protein
MYLPKKYKHKFFVPARTLITPKLLITHIDSEDNISDLMTKVTCGGKCRQLVGNILYDIFDDHPKN